MYTPLRSITLLQMSHRGHWYSSLALGKSVRIRLRGEGVSPVLKIDPADGRLEMGRVLEGDTVERRESHSISCSVSKMLHVDQG